LPDSAAHLDDLLRRAAEQDAAVAAAARGAVHAGDAHPYRAASDDDLDDDRVDAPGADGERS
jgi:ribosome-binding factor A